MTTNNKITVSIGTAHYSNGNLSAAAKITNARTVSFDAFAKGVEAAKVRSGKLPLAEYLETRAKSKGPSSPDQKAAKAIVDAEKSGAFYCIATFTGSRRHGDDFVSTNVVTHDYDAGKLAGEVVKARLHGLRYVAQTSYSHSPDAPMWRIHFLLSEAVTSRERYEAVSRAIWHAYLSDYVPDPKSFKPEQLWWSPSCPPDAVQYRQVINAAGEPFDVSSVAAGPAESAEQSPPSVSTDAGAEERRAAVAHLLGKISLEATVAKLTAEDGRPASNRDAWVKIGLAAKSYEPTAVAEFTAWSRGQSGFKDDADCATQWNSFDKSKTAKRATIDTLRWLAGEGGATVATADDFEVEDYGDTASEGLQVVSAFNRDHFAVKIEGKPFVCREKPDGTLEYMRPEDFTKWHAATKVSVKTGDTSKPHRVGDLWWSWKGKRTYERIVLAPPPLVAASGEYNLWRGFAVPPLPGDWTLFRKHLRDVVCGGEPETFDFVLSWIAHLVQQPGERAHVAIALIGAPGTGKGKVAQWIAALMPNNSVHISDRQHIVGRFNSHLEGKLFAFADEAMFAGAKADADLFKRLVTERTLVIEAKFMPPREAPNLLHIVLASNHEHALHLEADDRRYCVLRLSEKRQEDHDYFRAIDEQMAAGGLEAMLHDLLQRDLSKFNPRHAPMTAAKVEQTRYSLTGVPAWLDRQLDDERLVGRDVIEGSFASVDEWSDDGERNIVDKGAFYDDYAEWARARKERAAYRGHFWREVRDYVGGDDYRPRTDGRKRQYRLPALSRAKELFLAKLQRRQPDTAAIINNSEDAVQVEPDVVQVKERHLDRAKAQKSSVGPSGPADPAKNGSNSYRENTDTVNDVSVEDMLQ